MPPPSRGDSGTRSGASLTIQQSFSRAYSQPAECCNVRFEPGVLAVTISISTTVHRWLSRKWRMWLNPVSAKAGLPQSDPEYSCFTTLLNAGICSQTHGCMKRHARNPPRPARRILQVRRSDLDSISRAVSGLCGADQDGLSSSTGTSGTTAGNPVPRGVGRPMDARNSTGSRFVQGTSCTGRDSALTACMRVYASPESDSGCASISESAPGSNSPLMIADGVPCSP